MSKSYLDESENIKKTKEDKEDILRKLYKENKEKIKEGDVSIWDILPLTSEESLLKNMEEIVRRVKKTK